MSSGFDIHGLILRLTNVVGTGSRSSALGPIIGMISAVGLVIILASWAGTPTEVLRGLVDDTVLRDQEKLAELQKRSGMSPREFRELIETLRR